jgi:hypothetical protein
MRIENSFFDTISNNYIFNSGGVTAILITGTSGSNLIMGNSIQNTPSVSPGTVTSNVFRGNFGYNPVGKITSFIQGAFIGLCGTGTTLVSTTVYVVCGTDITLTCTGGTVTGIAEQDNLGNQIFSVANCAALPVQGVFIPIGYKMVFTFSGAPALSVYGN